MVGNSLGPYKVIEQLGAGGMGEVYLGEDTRLGRKVAIKVLPEEFAGDPERLARFEQEARAAAALNHPHIAAVHDVGTEGDTHFMVQEYMEGESLRAPLERGVLPLRKALALATEVAEGLAAAHAASIVHRDLKPDNIFVTKQGHAKILDFGLAKLTETGGGVDASMSPTKLGTVAGQVMGTAGYMAPEQVRGDSEIDGRADLFALGCVLYEMVTGRRAFTGENIHEVLSRLLSARPTPASEIIEGVPPKLEWILDKALAKEPQDRYQTAGDAVVDLRAATAGVETTASGSELAVEESMPPDPTAATTSSEAAPQRVAPAIAVLGAIVALAIGIGIGRTFFRSPAATTSSRVARLDVGEIGISLGSLYNRVIAIAPDSRAIALTVLDGLLIRRLESRDRKVLPGTDDAREPVFSPDSEQVTFWAAGRIKWAPIDGSAPVSVGPSITRPLGMAWGADGFIYVGQGRNGIWRVNPSGGDPEQVVTVGPEQLAHGPELLPGGEWLVFSIAAGMSGWDDAQIVAQSLLGGERVVLIERGREPRYAASGHLLFVRDGALFGAPLDVATPAVTGPAVPLESPIRTSSDDTTGAAYYDIADDGTLAYVAAEGSGLVNLSWVDERGAREELPVAPKPFGVVRLSPDQSRIAAEVWEPGVGTQIWVYDVDRAEGFRLSEEGVNRNPVWAPNGEAVYFASARDGDFDIWRRRVDMSSESEAVYEAPGDQAPESIARDASWMVLSELDPSNSDIWRISLEGDPAPEALVATASDEAWPNLSPDGRHLVYAVQEAGTWSVYVSEIETKQRRLVSSDGWFTSWTMGGSRIFFNNNDGVAFVEVADIDRFDWGEPQVFQRRQDTFIDFEVSRDGRRIVRPTAATSDIDAIVVVLNWFEELTRLVPPER